MFATKQPETCVRSQILMQNRKSGRGYHIYVQLLPRFNVWKSSIFGILSELISLSPYSHALLESRVIEWRTQV